jgi:hypothetical protein
LNPQREQLENFALPDTGTEATEFSFNEELTPVVRPADKYKVAGNM